MAFLLDKHRAVAERVHQAERAFAHFGIGCRLKPCETSPVRAEKDDGGEVILFGTNNYLGLTHDPSCIAAAAAALKAMGVAMTGSRAANGTSPLHRRLEDDFARLYGCGEAIVFSTGYQANLGVIGALVDQRDRIFLDADSHASIYDAAALSGARIIRFRHNDPDDLDARLERAKDSPGGKLIVIEGLYSMFADTAPIAEFVAVKDKHRTALLCDEAHSFGAYGDKGRGIADQEGCGLDKVDYIVGTFSKSLAGIGGFAVSRDPLFSVLRFISRPYLYTAAPAPSTMASVAAALERVIAGDDLRRKLWDNAARLHDGLIGLGFDLAAARVSPIAAIRCGSPERALQWWNALFAMGVYVNLVLPPGAPENESLLRCSLSAAHEADHIERALQGFAALEKPSEKPSA